MNGNHKASVNTRPAATAEDRLTLAAALIALTRKECPEISDEDLFVALAHAAASIYGPGSLRTWLGE